MASGILEVLLVNAKGLGDTDFIGTAPCFCVSLYISFFYLEFQVMSNIMLFFFFSVFLILSSSLSWYLLFWLPKCLSWYLAPSGFFSFIILFSWGFFSFPFLARNLISFIELPFLCLVSTPIQIKVVLWFY